MLWCIEWILQYSILGYITLHFILFYSFILCELCDIISYCFIVYDIVFCFITLDHSVKNFMLVCYVTAYYSISHDITLHNISLFYYSKFYDMALLYMFFIWHYRILHWSILHHVMVCYVLLCIKHITTKVNIIQYKTYSHYQGFGLELLGSCIRGSQVWYSGIRVTEPCKIQEREPRKNRPILSHKGVGYLFFSGFALFRNPLRGLHCALSPSWGMWLVLWKAVTSPATRRPTLSAPQLRLSLGRSGIFV